MKLKIVKFFNLRKSLILGAIGVCLFAASILIFETIEAFQSKTPNQSTKVFVGSATHKRFLFEIYKVDIYSSEELQNVQDLPQAIDSGEQGLFIEMHFLMGINKKEFTEAWVQSFNDNCDRYCDDAEKDFEELVSNIPGFKKGDFLNINIDRGTTTVKFGKKTYESTNRAFAHALLLTWIGKNPPSQEFKNKLLSQLAN